MYLIVGLGNPEPEYAYTRHNMGFDTINKIAKELNIELKKTKFNSICGEGKVDNKKILLIKPQTFMNNSGESVEAFISYYKIPVENMLVIYDDMDTDIGTVRIRAKGGAGSHNGMKSIVKELNSEEFPRIRVGIGKPKNEFDKIDYVIGRIPNEEYINLQEGIDIAKDATIFWIKNGIDNTMNKYNIKNRKEG